MHDHKYVMSILNPEENLASNKDFPPSSQPTASFSLLSNLQILFVSHSKCQRASQLFGLWCHQFSFYSKRSRRFAFAVFLRIYNEVSCSQYPKATIFRQNILEEICKQESQPGTFVTLSTIKFFLKKSHQASCTASPEMIHRRPGTQAPVLRDHYQLQ